MLNRLKELTPSIFALLIVAMTIGAAIGASVVTYVQLGSRGRIRTYGIEVYWDSAMTTKVTHLDWGTLSPGDSAIRTVFLANTGNHPITVTKAESDWLPSEAASYLTLSWNYTTGTILGKNEVIPVDFILSVDSSITGIDVFDFWITITGSDT